jgi:hypothetical protein
VTTDESEFTNERISTDDRLWGEIRAEIDPYITDSARGRELEDVFRQLRGSRNDADPPAGWDSVRSEILQAASATRSHRNRGLRALAACLAFAAVASLFYGIRAGREVERLRHQIQKVESTAPQVLSKHEAKEPLAVFDEVASYYDGQATWVALTGTRVQLGLGSRPARTPAAGSPAVVVRIALPDGMARPHLTTDVVAWWGVTSAFRNVVAKDVSVWYEIAPLTIVGTDALVRLRISASAVGLESRGESDELMGTLRIPRGQGRTFGVIRVGPELWNVTVSAQWRELEQHSDQRA